MEFAHTYESLSGVTIYEVAESTLILYKADGTYHTVDSREMPALDNVETAISKAMSAIMSLDDHCDLYRFGEYYGTAEYVDLTPDSWFSRMQVVFSTPYC